MACFKSSILGQYLERAEQCLHLSMYLDVYLTCTLYTCSWGFAGVQTSSASAGKEKPPFLGSQSRVVCKPLTARILTAAVCG